MDIELRKAGGTIVIAENKMSLHGQKQTFCGSHTENVRIIPQVL